jgi:hypothetical protein
MVVVSKSPDFFPAARDFHRECGPHQLQAALRALGHDVPIEELYFTEKHRERDWSFPWHLPKILERYGALARMGFWTRPSFSENLKRSIEADRPTLFVVNSIHGKGDWHWLSAWGHDEGDGGERHFLCYDSQQPESTEPFGNARYSASLLERQLPFRGTFAVTILGN